MRLRPNSILVAVSLTACSRPTTRCSEARTQVQEVVRAVELFKATSSSVPQTLDALIAAKILEPTSLVDAWGHDLLYYPAVDGYRLLSAGPDGMAGTADDIDALSVAASCRNSGCDTKF